MTSLRQLPGIDRLLNSPALAPVTERFGSERVKAALRNMQSEWRRAGSPPDWADDPATYAEVLTAKLRFRDYQPVFNLTGTVIHTNLGRALLSEELLAEITPLVTRPVNLEFDLDSGSRGNRDGIVAERLKLLTGAEAATVVNNGAAALMLVLNTFALGRTVPVSRGELIEIGGSFRLPAIMERSGCLLREVGTTNRTHLKDFADAADDTTGMLLKVHPSNYQVSGFTSSVGNEELAALAQERGVPFCVDLGAGSLVNLTRWGLPHEPMPQQLLSQGVDLVTFSGDKLLGGMQAGIILGRGDLIAELNRNPMKRALRTDKVTLVYLSRLLSLYERPEQLAERLPLLRTLTAGIDELEARAEKIRELLQKKLPDCEVSISDSRCQIGSGSLPDQTIASVAVCIRMEQESKLIELQTRLRELPVPVIARIGQGRLWLDTRGAERLDELCDNLSHLKP